MTTVDQKLFRRDSPEATHGIMDKANPSAEPPAGRPPADDRIATARLVLVPVNGDDADELAVIFADERLYRFTGGKPGSVEELRATLSRLAEDRAADATAQLNWVARRRAGGQAVGMLQAVFGDGGRTAEVAWLTGMPWQGQGFAAEAAAAVVAWLEARAVEQVTAWIRPDHRASEAVATRAGLMVTDEVRITDKHQQPERLWKRDRSARAARW
jgi:RimJ/RimL family protein N-acetyltransferase